VSNVALLLQHERHGWKDLEVRIYAYPADEFGCGHYRVIWPAQEAERRGMDVTIVLPNERTQLGARIGRNGELTEVIYPQDADLIVMQRPTHKFLAQAVPLLRQRGVSVVVDMDDDLRTIHPANPAWAMLHPRERSPHTWQNAAEACRVASLVTVSTNALVERYGQHGRVHVLRNSIPESFLDVQHEDSDIIGWGGSVHSHPNDLQEMGSSIAAIVRGGGRFAVVGSGDDVARILGLDDQPDSTGIIDFYDWPNRLTELGIAVAPLADTIFNRAKSWLKPMEYSAVGIPWVASDRVEYRRLHELGCGLVVKKARDWESTLRRLVGNPSMRSDLAAAGRDVVSRLTFTKVGQAWVDAWEHAREIDTQANLVGGHAS
jgi:glycosyltransferase involved in cell wall biosynthesis